jgi:hypothetical protein
MSFHVVILQRDTKGWYSRKCSIVKGTLLLVSSAEEQDEIEMSGSISTKMLHFLEHRPLVSLAEKQHANL